MPNGLNDYASYFSGLMSIYKNNLKKLRPQRFPDSVTEDKWDKNFLDMVSQNAMTMYLNSLRNQGTEYGKGGWSPQGPGYGTLYGPGTAVAMGHVVNPEILNTPLFSGWNDRNYYGSYGQEYENPSASSGFIEPIGSSRTGNYTRTNTLGLVRKAAKSYLSRLRKLYGE